MSTEFTSSVPSTPDGAGSPPPASSADTTTPEQLQPTTPETSASTTQPQAAAATTQGTPQESVGLKQQREHIKSLETDLAKYKASHELLERNQPAIDLFSEIKKLENFDVVKAGQAIYDANPENCAKLARFFVREFPEYVQEVLKDPQFKSLFQTAQTPQQQRTTYQDPEFTEPDDELGILKREVADLRKFRDETLAERRTHQEKTTQQTVEQRVEAVETKIFGAVQEELKKLQGWDEANLKALKSEIVGSALMDEKFQEQYRGAVRAAKANAKAAQEDYEFEAKKHLTRIIASAIMRNNKLVAPPTPAAPPARHEVKGASTTTQTTPKEYKSNRLNDPELQADLVTEIERTFGRR